MLKKFLVPLLIFCTIFTAKVSAAEFDVVSYSAMVKLQWLAYSGQPEAKKILKALGKPNIYGKENLKDYDRLEKLNSVFQELNYAATVEYVRKNAYTNIMDIGGGYTPRAVVFARDGRKYIGAELAAIAISATEIMPGVIGKKYPQDIFYDEVLVEDREAMLGTADEFNGQICIIENGLQIYLTPDRANVMFDLIHEILVTHGGCFITTDFALKDYFKDIAAALYGRNQAQILYDETKAMYEQLFDSKIYDNAFETLDDAVAFLAEHGLEVKAVPLMTDTSKLYCTKNMTPQQISEINRIAAKSYLWVITAAK